uniref:DNA-directed RNA polymerase subunit alpha n=1 Tax=Cryptomonas sp. CCAC 1634B TaxID=2051848 RepID=A0A679CBR3_9CRYP|nr:RNA polymerase subunit alpha [Cryptomonas sp. CCAC 1634B]
MTQFKIECIESKRGGPSNSYGKFLLEPLCQGQGVTVGNALRRTLLSDLEGSAIVAVKIAGVVHEFSTIPGVREDVLEILLNLKEIVFKCGHRDYFTGRLLVHGPAVVTAANFEFSTGIEIVNPQQYLATLCTSCVLEMEVRIEQGKGYLLVDTAVSPGFLHVDAVFMPVKKVMYAVEEVSYTPCTVQDRLTLEIWTNGSISPQEALLHGLEALATLFTSLHTVRTKAREDTRFYTGGNIDQVSIEELQLSVRAHNCLKRACIRSVADLLDYSQEDLLEIKNFGQKSAEEVVGALQKRLGIHLPKENQ